MRHVFTVDTEDWPQLMCSYLGHETSISEQFASSIEKTLELLEEQDIRATFFVVAPHAAERPEIVREIAARGHEVASHGSTHQKLGSFVPPRQFRDDLSRSIDTLEEITGEKVCGYRAPFFSLMPKQSWAWDIMLDCGLEYDSSLTTLLWRNEGVAIPNEPFVCEMPSGREIVEVPALARQIGPITGRLIGGRTLRVFPLSVTLSHLEECKANGLPAMIYVHSYETSPECLSQYLPQGLPFFDRAKLFVSAKAFEFGMGRMNRTLQVLLAHNEWGPMCGLIDDLKQGPELPRVKINSNGEVSTPENDTLS